MKFRIFPLLTLLVVTLSWACKSGDSGELATKKAKLEELRTSLKKTQDEISALEKEIAKLDTSAESTSRKHLVQTSELTYSAFAHYIDIQGRVDDEQNVTVTARMPGNVVKIYVKTGDNVKEGQVLAVLDDQTIKAGISEVNQQLTFATSLYNKQKALWDQKVGTEIQYLTAKNNKEALEKKLVTLNEQLEMARIISPISGQIDENFLKVGQAVAPGVPAFRVVNLSGLKIKADVPEVYAGKLKANNSVIISFPDLSLQIDGSLSYVGKVINNMTRTFNVEAPLNSKEGEFRPNQIAVLRIIDYQNPKAVVVPVKVVQNSDEGRYVYIAVTEGKKSIAKKILVTEGSSYEGQVEIIKGLEPGMKIITTGFQNLNDGEELSF